MSSGPQEPEAAHQPGASADESPGGGPEPEEAGGLMSDLTSTISLGGADVDDAVGTDSDHAVAEALPAGGALLIVRRGPNAGSRFLLEVPLVTAGRHPDSDIFLDDVTVSRRHAQFVQDPTGYRVKDVGSLNGTYVNRHRIDDVLLANGDEVQIGKYRLVYLIDPDQAGRSGGSAR
jgi:pSer/pThr/pTyr-binding forkhead associated (FHA) protein